MKNMLFVILLLPVLSFGQAVDTVDLEKNSKKYNGKVYKIDSINPLLGLELHMMETARSGFRPMSRMEIRIP